MSYLGGIDYGSDQISSHKYLDDVLLYNSYEDNHNESHGRHYSGYDYHPNYNPRQNFIPSQLSNTNNLVNNSVSQMGKLTKSISNKTDKLTDLLRFSPLDLFLLFLILFITIIYCMSLYSFTQRMTEMHRYNDLSISIESLRTLLVSQNKT